MDVKNGGCDYQNAFVEGGEEFYFNGRILCREASAGRSSSVYYRRAEGVPFKWEKKPGTPNTKLIDEDPNNNNNNIIPPLSPPPSLQSLGLPLPCFDHDTQQKSTHVFSWRKIKKMLHAKIGKKSGGGLHEHKSETQREDFRVGDSDREFIASLNNSNLSSSSSSSCSNGPFCYGSPWNIKPIMDETGNTSRYYSKEHHKAFFRQSQDGYGFSLSSILSRLSSVDESSRFYYSITAQGIPFQWEMQPGAPKTPPGNDVIPPPTPPPLAQSLALPKPRIGSCQPETPSYSPWMKIWVGIKHKKMMKGNKRLMAARKDDKEMRKILFHSLLQKFLGERSCIGP